MSFFLSGCNLIYCTHLVPAGLEQTSYANGTWIKQVIIHDIAKVAHPIHVEELLRGGIISENATLQKKLENSSTNPLLVTDAQLLAVNAFNKNTSSASQMNEESKALSLEADLATQKGVTLLLQGKDSGFDEAKMLNDQSKIFNESADLAALQGTAALFKEKDSAESKRYLEEAVQLNSQSQAAEKEASIAVGEEAAQLLLSNLSHSLQKEAGEVKKESIAAQEEEVAALFKSAGAQNRMAEAMKQENDLKKAVQVELAAATMVQNAWRSRKARERRRELQERRQRLLEHAFARKLQTAYRARLARKKVMDYC